MQENCYEYATSVAHDAIKMTQRPGGNRFKQLIGKDHQKNCAILHDNIDKNPNMIAKSAKTANECDKNEREVFYYVSKENIPQIGRPDFHFVVKDNKNNTCHDKIRGLPARKRDCDKIDVLAKEIDAYLLLDKNGKVPAIEASRSEYEYKRCKQDSFCYKLKTERDSSGREL